VHEAGNGYCKGQKKKEKLGIPFCLEGDELKEKPKESYSARPRLLCVFLCLFVDDWEGNHSQAAGIFSVVNEESILDFFLWVLYAKQKRRVGGW